MTTQPLRVGIIGAGSMTMKRHLPALARLRDEGLCELVEVCDINIAAAQAAASKYKVVRASYAASALTACADIDAVCIFGPAEVHYRHGLEALRAGKHLFVEKPPAKNTTQLQEMCALAAEKNRIAVAGFNRRFQLGIKEIKKRVREDAVLSAEATFHKPFAGVPVPFGMRTWLGVNGIHALDTLCFVMGGRPTALWSVQNGSAPGSEENFSAIIAWGDRHATFAANNSAGSRLERYVFHTPGTSFVYQGGTLAIEHSEAAKEELQGVGDSDGGIYEEFRSFLDSIGGDTPVHTLSNALVTMKLVELIEDNHQGVIDWSWLDVATKSPASRVIQSASLLTPRAYKEVGHPAILVLNPDAMKFELPRLNQRFKIVYETDLVSLSEDKRNSIVAILTGGPQAVAPRGEHFTQFPNLAVLGVLGASVKRWGGDDALRHGVAILNTADVYADAVAEFIVMQALVGLRKASMSHDVLRHGGWEFHTPTRSSTLTHKLVSVMRRTQLLSMIKPFVRQLRRPTQKMNASRRAATRTLKGRTVGILGYGEITKKTIPLFKAHGCDVVVYSEYADDGLVRGLGGRRGTLGEVLAADVVSLQRGLSERTKRSFGAAEINSLRAGSVFINASRAGLVDTHALIERLKRKDIFACLDVFDEEPLPAHHVLRKLPNVFLTSHLAASLRHVDGLSARSAHMLVEKLCSYIDGKEEVSVKDAAHFKNMT